MTLPSEDLPYAPCHGLESPKFVASSLLLDRVENSSQRAVSSDAAFDFALYCTFVSGGAVLGRLVTLGCKSNSLTVLG
jgi:hypothetical protein